jgi:hypothetical protein
MIPCAVNNFNDTTILHTFIHDSHIQVRPADYFVENWVHFDKMSRIHVAQAIESYEAVGTYSQ